MNDTERRIKPVTTFRRIDAADARNNPVPTIGKRETSPVPTDAVPTTVVDLVDVRSGGSSRPMEVQNLRLLVESLPIDNRASRNTNGDGPSCSTCDTACCGETCAMDADCPKY